MAQSQAADMMDEDVYLEMIEECFETVVSGTLKPLSEISEGNVEPRCDEAVGGHDVIGAEENPRVNAAIVSLSIATGDTMDHLKVSDYEDGEEYLAALAHGVAKRDLIEQVLDERAAIIKHAKSDDSAE